MPTIEREIRNGVPMQVGDYEITPQAQLLQVRFANQRGGLIWNRPKSVLVRTANGEEIRLPVVDYTRVAIWSMLAGGIIGAIVIGLMRRKREPRQ